MTNYTKSEPKPGESTWLWMLKIVSGALILVVLIIHLIVNHFVAEGGLLSFQDVVNYYHNYPIVPIMEGFFLVFVIVHSLIGVRSIVLDLKPKKSLVRVLDILFVVAGVGFTIYGIWLLGAVLSFPPNI
jgi:succinate dehydrogenase / fumarate reductase, membrane anchor subunit